MTNFNFLDKKKAARGGFPVVKKVVKKTNRLGKT